MDPDKIYEYKIEELVNKLNYYTKLYDEGHPEISDQEWDNMYFELQDLEHYYNFYLPDSPTQKVNYQLVTELKKVQHNHPMLSLDKTKSIDEINSFIGTKDYIAMAKLDGLTCSLKYSNGKLVSAETRGNGFEGEDITHNALVIQNIPKRINFKDELIIDGEVICTYKNFEQFADTYKNPRNFASGSIRLLDSKECANRNLTFVAWDCIKGLKEDTLIFKLDKLSELGFAIVPYTIDATREYEIKSLQELCAKLGYPIDGLVYKYDKISDYEAAGKTDHHFKGGLAYKFYDEVYETRIRKVEWTMGRTGKLSPVAIFDPVDIDGTEVSRANMHNISIMEELGIKEYGTLVEVYKANMIIPQIARVVPEMTCDVYIPDNYIQIPETCPICGQPTKIIQDNESKVLYCANPNCEGKLINRIDHFFGKKGLNAKGLSKATIEKLIDWGWVNGIKDMFMLSEHADEWKKKAGFGEKSVNNIITSIRESGNTDLESAISAAGIPLIGRTVARQIASSFNTYEDFREAIRTFDFSEIDGFGYEMNKSLKNFDFNELDYIVENYLTIQNKIEANNNNKKLENLTFCITGKITNWKNRDELVKYIEDLGGKCVGAVSANVNYLINNDIESTSAKNKKAKELKIEIIDEENFLKKFDLQK